jgi:glutamate--cysteine ligase
MNSLGSIYSEVAEGIGDELLWPFSMPPKLPPEEDIPIAKFPETDSGRTLNIYRNGLSLRYGKKMQMISGIHYNFSFGDQFIDFLYGKYGDSQSKRDFTDEMYLAVIRNFMRYRWLLVYLFGASPLYDPTYSSVIEKELNAIRKCCPDLALGFEHITKYATSLRVSRFGYSDNADAGQNVFFNSMSEYFEKLRRLMSTKSERYARLGMHKGGEQLQLNENILQKESEFYSSIRPKQNLRQGETPIEALKKRGIKYLEVRVLDVNPFEKLGITLEQILFLQVFMLFCLFERSDFIDEESFSEISSNYHTVALLGRNSELSIYNANGTLVLLRNWGQDVVLKLRQIAALLDHPEGGKYTRAIDAEAKKLTDLSLLPSEKIYREIRETGLSFKEYGVHLAEAHKNKKEHDIWKTAV